MKVCHWTRFASRWAPSTLFNDVSPPRPPHIGPPNLLVSLLESVARLHPGTPTRPVTSHLHLRPFQPSCSCVPRVVHNLASRPHSPHCQRFSVRSARSFSDHTFLVFLPTFPGRSGRLSSHQHRYNFIRRIYFTFRQSDHQW